MKKNLTKIFIILFSISTAIALLAIALLAIYIYVLPSLVSNNKVISLIKNTVKKELNLDLDIEKPELKTALSPEISFKIDKLNLKKDSVVLVDLSKFDTVLSFKKILNKEIKINSLHADNLVIKADKLIEALPQSNNETKKQDWKIDFYSIDINLKNLYLTYNLNKNLIEIQSKNTRMTRFKDNLAVGFESIINIYKNNKKYFSVKSISEDDFKFYSNKIKVTDFDCVVNSSKITINSMIDKKNIFLNVKSSNFKLADVFQIINSNLIIQDGENLMKPLINPKGAVAFDVDYKNNALNGYIKVNNTQVQIKDLTKLPIFVQKGLIKISKDKIDFNSLVGYYGKNKKNEININGDIKDYYKSLDSNITVDTVVNNEFLKDYIAPLISNTVVKISKPTKTRIIYKSKNNIMDITWLIKIAKGVNLGVDDSVSKLIDHDRALKGDFHIENNILDIKNINYYIAPDIHKGVKLQPIITLNGKTTLDGKLDNFGFEFTRPMPSELLNVLTKEKTFKKGTIKGKLHIAYKNNIPYLKSDMEIEKTLVPSQRLFIKKAKLSTNSETINADITGGFKRVKFDFNGKIKNELVAPYIIKDLKLHIDKINVEKFLASVNSENAEVDSSNVNSSDDIQDDNFMFDTNLVRIENCDFILDNGVYKELEFGNIKAKLTLDDKGILNIQSNKFDIAGGISTLKVQSDLKNLKHYLRLGMKDVDSNLMSKVLLNLDNEVVGLASGLVELNTDKSLKLNGKIGFIIKDGTIGKIGLVEYLLKIVSLFRNPVAMINPTTVMDVVSIPEGKFDKIQGELELKNNVVIIRNIKSYSKTLSALIKGIFDMERHDSSIRIYTRFSNSKNTKFEFLRNVSLSALANKVQMHERNDANYYASELSQLPSIEVEDKKTQIYLTNVEGDIEKNNFMSSLKRIK